MDLPRHTHTIEDVSEMEAIVERYASEMEAVVAR